ncbi:protein Z-dependent protease inhibitor-like [Festucalex cinctus]
MWPIPLPVLAVLVLAIPLDCQPPAADLVGRSSDFSARLYRALASRTDDNVLVSTLSVWRGLAALLGSAGGATREQLQTALGLAGLDPQNLPDVSSSLATSNLKQGVAVFAAADAQPAAAFAERLGREYGGEVKTAGFGAGRDAADAVNAWVRSQAGDQVQDGVADVDPQAKLLLATAASYQGRFSQAFNASASQDERFYVSKYQVATVAMMSRTDKYFLAYDRALKSGVLKLPMTDGAAMLLVLPDEDAHVGAVEDEVTGQKIRSWIGQLKKTKLEVQLPRFFLDRSYSLRDVLRALGVLQIFQDDADLSAMGLPQGAKVAQVLHKAVTTMDESGQGDASGGGASVFSSPPPRLTVNRPFLFVVYQQASGAPFLMGRLRDPTKK